MLSKFAEVFANSTYVNLYTVNLKALDALCQKKSKSLNITVLFVFHSVIEIIESLSVCTRGVAFTPTASLRLRLTRQLMASYNAEPTHGPLPLL